MTGLIILGIILIFMVSIIGCVGLSPQFGAKPEGESIERIKKSSNYKDGKFFNTPDSIDGFTFSDYVDMTIEMMKTRINATPPERTLPPLNNEIRTLGQANDSLTQITWLGHSSVLINIDGKTLLLDPILSDAFGPLTFMSKSKRFGNSLPLTVDDLPRIDAVLISHDHYDHLDYNTIKQLKGKVEHYFVPLGISAHLKSWGIEETRITELNWWEDVQFKEITFIATPAQHFSGRGLFDKFTTLWTSWVIKGKKHKIYFSGDTGYFDGFKKIGEKYGPFDLTIIECGQYSELWPYHHIFPEQTAQAHLDLNGKILLPIHWGTFLMSPSHDWNEPLERLVKKAAELNLSLTTPKIGETISLENRIPVSKWWKKFKR